MRIEFEDGFFSRLGTKKYFSNGLLLDTGPLYLMLVGSLYPAKLQAFNYYQYQYEMLIKFLHGIECSKYVITPHIFHELYKDTQKIFNTQHISAMTKMGKYLTQMEEEQVCANDLLSCPYFQHFEIGEHSLYLSRKETPSAILTGEQRNKFCGKLQKNENTLVMSLDDIFSYLSSCTF